MFFICINHSNQTHLLLAIINDNNSLWATTGQTALENSKICLLNATATGCEILKNLVLPGTQKTYLFLYVLFFFFLCRNHTYTLFFNSYYYYY